MLRSAMLEAVPENAVRFLGHDTHEHDAPHLIHVVSGTAEVSVDGTLVQLGPRENLWLAAGVPHAARYSADGVVLGPLLDAKCAPPERFRSLGVVPRLSEIASIILGASPRTDDQIAVFRGALSEVLRALNSDYFALRFPAHPIARRVAQDARTSERTLEQLAVTYDTSVRHLQRLFRDETGLPFTRWRARARLNLAVRSLHGGDGLAAAAHRAGYASRAGLIKALSRETGASPRALATTPLQALQQPR
ncbi:helix-turn-helix domain-containing protein [Leucobacter sp. NPDC058333]|uniref:helix-turn-helix transcriptional regulator n=1 Tax=Leucobacter sp. NPDC058333 TaxID=3346450 RepID=UPI00365F8CEA